MATINKLAILGIRSFGQDQPEIIEFLPPLTLIVGHNGSGKTTIIECLKYITTGELPPGAKTGGAFIHDPRMAARKDVVAQVRLLFHNTNNLKIVCTRSMQLSIARNGTRKQSTLDGQMMLETENGERVAISSRCAEMDVQMPLSLGVSKAILENVIFCHQEDSFWPLSEPGPLKKKFDDIFENARYTRALTELKELKKNQEREVKADTQALEFMKADKERSDRVTKDSQFLLEEIGKKQDRIDVLQIKINDNQAETQKLFSTYQGFQQTVAELSLMKEKIAHTKETMASLSKDMQEYTESDEDLIDMRDSFDQRNKEAQEVMKDKNTKRKQLSDELQRVREELGKRTVDVGALEEAKRANDRNAARREEVVKEVSRRHGFRGMEVIMDDGEIDKMKTLLLQSLKDEKGQLDRIKRESAIQEKGLTDQIQELNFQQSTLSAQRQSAQEKIRNLNSRISDLQGSLDALSVDEADLAILKSSMDETNTSLQTAQEEFVQKAWDTKISSLETQISQVDNELKAIHAELTSTSAQSEFRAKIGVLKADITKKTQARSMLISSNAERFKALVGVELNANSLDSQINVLLRRKTEELDEAERDLEGTSKEVTQYEAKVNTCKEQLRDKKREKNAAHAKIMEFCEDNVEEFPGTLKSWEDSVVDKRKELQNLQYAGYFFSNAVREAEENQVCAMCKRGFGEHELDAFKDTIQHRIVKTPELEAKLMNELKENETQVGFLKAAVPVYDTYIRLEQNEIPKLEDDMKTASAKLADAAKGIDQRTTAVGELKVQIKTLENLKRPVQDIARYTKEVEDLTREIGRLEAQLGESGGALSGAEIREKMDSLNEQRSKLSKESKAMAVEKEKARVRIQGLKDQLSNIRWRLGEGENKVNAKKTFQKDLEEAQTQLRKAQEDVKTFAVQMDTLQPELGRIQEQLRMLREQTQAEEESANSKILKVQDSIHQFENVDNEIKAYRLAGGDERLAAAKKAVEELNARIASIDDEIMALSLAISEAESNIANMRQLERNVADNLRYRELKREIGRMRDKVTEMEKENAETELDKYKEQAEKLRKAITKWTAEQATLAGEIKQMDLQLQKNNEQLRTEYRDAHEKYRRQNIKVKTTVAATDDLGKYAKALDSAIMKYHSMKMEEINRIIGELWRNTYVGTDVDTILIRSEKEDQKANRIYNYRVCMVKDSVELDMRGRCSAGQKVLACIIIRLALAESFGDKFGVLALDEPTTNLDRENIESLAKSLASLVRHRRAQKNFQLIIITHDEEFLRFMGCSDFCENYYRAKKHYTPTADYGGALMKVMNRKTLYAYSLSGE